MTVNIEKIWKQKKSKKYGTRWHCGFFVFMWESMNEASFLLITTEKKSFHGPAVIISQDIMSNGFNYH